MTPVLEVRQIVVGDVRSPVLVGGPDDAKAGEAVVFVHGNPGSGADWCDLMEPIAAFATVIAPDMPGFRGAEKRRDQEYTVASYAAHLGGIVDQLGLSSVHLVLHDFGGPWGLVWAAQNLDRVASVTLLNTGVLIDYSWHRLARVWRVPVVGELFQAAAVGPLTRALLAHDNPGLDSHWVRHIVENFRPAGTKRAILQLYRSAEAGGIAELAPIFAARDLPCQVVWGTEDVYIPTVQAQRQRQSFPSAQITLVDGAGHWVWLEQPDRVRELVEPFLRKHVSGG